jgi:hypothetical protein
MSQKPTDMPTSPMLVIPSNSRIPQRLNLVKSRKFLTSSLMRSLYTGSMVVFRNDDMPLYKIERKLLDEIIITPQIDSLPGAGQNKTTQDYIFELCDHINPAPRQWVIVADEAGLALRNIDHLIPPDAKSPYGPVDVDFFWAHADSVSFGAEEDNVSTGFWAVRGEHLAMVLLRWKIKWSEAQAVGELDVTKVWTQVVRELPLHKKRFETGEVSSPSLGAVDWERVSNCAFVTVPTWPPLEQRKFLEALYFGTYFGDETGLMLNILDP